MIYFSILCSQIAKLLRRHGKKENTVDLAKIFVLAEVGLMEFAIDTVCAEFLFKLLW